ncbi:MAG: class II fructose-bisphosphate aldolase [Spirochaetaceae bacterium]|jgi:ketose-bisphosphate aldolase|nr:class II fructose-bisphosphate aldolase [Spirochaetaceae bacterium]
MELVTLRDLLPRAKKERYAVGAFNFNGYEDAAGILAGAEEARSPVIMMASQGACQYIGVYEAAGLVQGMAKRAKVPVCLHLDHATDYDLIKEAVKAGFSSVMVDASAKPYEDNIRESAAIVRFARDYNCSVEAELGKVGGKEEHIVVEDRSATFTDPAEVPRYVEETGIDALAIAFGSVHGFYKSEPKLDFERLAAILKLTDCPLVLHGGTGIPIADIQRCITMGLAKVNVGTELKAAFANTIRKMCAEVSPDEFDPRKFLKPVKAVCAAIVKEKLTAFGSAGKA